MFSFIIILVMPLLKQNSRKLFMSHIPKTGGESILNLLKNNNVNISLQSGYIKPCSYQHRHKDDPFLKEVLDNEKVDFSFCVIRTPLDRIKSEYRFVRSNPYINRGNTTINSEDFHNFVVEMFKEYEKNNYVADNHIRPQIDFIHEGMKVYRFGEWDAVIKDLSDYLNLKNTKLPHSNLFSRKEWSVKDETIELIKNFYVEDYKLFEQNNL